MDTQTKTPARWVWDKTEPMPIVSGPTQNQIRIACEAGKASRGMQQPNPYPSFDPRHAAWLEGRNSRETFAPLRWQEEEVRA